MMKEAININMFQKDADSMMVCESIPGSHCGKVFSSILSTLIKEAGRLCEWHASDLFQRWKRVESDVSENTFKTGSYLFGFHNTGVDDAEAIFKNIENESIFRHVEYLKIWRLDVKKDGVSGLTSMTLYWTVMIKEGEDVHESE